LTAASRLRRRLSGTSPGKSSPNAAKIAFVHLDKPFDRQAILQLRSDDLTEPMKEMGARLAIDAHQIRRAPSRHPSDKKLRQSILRLFLQTAMAYPRAPILDPARIWDRPFAYNPIRLFLDAVAINRNLQLTAA
jgi:hypothetical protein